MGCGWLLIHILGLIFIRRGFPRVIWYGVVVGALVGVIIALIRDDWLILLYGCAAGCAAGVVFELVVVWIDRIDNWRRSRK
jgi:hypothetical protein